MAKSFDYQKAKQEFIDELDAGKYVTNILPNEGEDYQDVEGNDIAAFAAHLKTKDAKLLSAETFKK